MTLDSQRNKEEPELLPKGHQCTCEGLKQAIPEGPGGPEGPGPRPPPALPSTILALEKELYFILSTSGPWGEAPKPKPQAVIGSGD